jgi:hypothetical protein
MQVIYTIHAIRLHSGIQRSAATLIAALMISFFSHTAGLADNFVITEYPTSDPAPSVFIYNDETRVYLYCTQDKMISGVYPIDTLHCYSSDDMFHWRDEGVVLDERSCGNWANRGAHQLWAPTVVFYKEKYRLFVSAVSGTGTDDASARVFTATADSPTGPFIPSTNPPYLSNISIGSIDPFCYIDTLSDGSIEALLVVRNGKSGTSIHMARLNEDATDVVGQPWVVRSLPTNGYKEGTWIIKRDGYYYLIYATANGTPRETINYATAPVSSQGGINENTQWTYRGVIFDMNSNQWTIHSGACHFKPKGETEANWYAFWHGVQEPEMGGKRLFSAGQGRCTGIEYINFTDDDPPLIRETPKTRRGVGICKAATDSIQVDRFSGASGCAVRTIQYPGLSTAPAGWVVSNIANDGTCTYKDVDFTPEPDSQLATVTANVASTADNSSIDVLIGSTLLATIPVPNTGDINSYTTTDPVQLAEIPEEGVHDLTLKFATQSNNSFQVNWIQFGEIAGTAVKKYGMASGGSGFTCRRINKNAFTIHCKEDISNATVSAINLQGRELVGAVTVQPFTRNALMIDLTEHQFSKGVFLLSIQNGDRINRIKFSY